MHNYQNKQNGIEFNLLKKLYILGGPLIYLTETQHRAGSHAIILLVLFLKFVE